MDHFKTTIPGLDAPASSVFAVTPDDSADLAVATRGINVTTAGHVRITTVDGSEAVIFVAAGGVFPVRAQRIWATGTDAAGIVGLY
ncbi:spike base protein, RCAP_Rcc01079 family [Roseisalinus antarcticus]|uniref:Uncharacterized protein n=1 Tax=Roseisalinus antarcticus TaxID=254357 RepID=A0A1Y5RWK2_9RHOB|nr:hypothetical protein [Roseisalinus antarcticus]SLN27097.1 hypothetical protein ROA7023_00853 [Roseisalinus antarcticus]